MKQPLERSVKSKVKARFDKEFTQCYRFMPVLNGMGAPSLDFLFCISGLFVGVETKRPPLPGQKKPEPTPRQQTTMDEIRAAGGQAFLIYDDATLDDAVSRIHFYKGV